MNDPVRSLGEIAGKLARNPLGIIALFIVLIYGLATATTIYTGNLTPSERLPLTWFLVLFPVLVLLSFIHLVIHHSDKLYGPGDFRDEANFMQLKTAVLLGAAAAKKQNPATDDVHARARKLARTNTLRDRNGTGLSTSAAALRLS